MKYYTLFFSVIVCIASVGCAFNRPNYKRTTYQTNGVVIVERLSVPTYAIWPATTELGKQRVSIGKTISVGTSALSEDGGGTNMVEALRAIDSILGKIR